VPAAVLADTAQTTTDALKSDLKRLVDQRTVIEKEGFSLWPRRGSAISLSLPPINSIARLIRSFGFTRDMSTKLLGVPNSGI